MVKTSKASSSQGSTKYEMLLDAALRLFYREGYHAVGIDSVIAEAQVAKMTLYNHFPSKTELILAVLDRQASRMAEARRDRIEAAGNEPRAQFLAIFDWLEEWFRQPTFNGCAFIRAVGEFPSADSEVNRAVVKYRTRFLELLESLLASMDIREPSEFAQRILLLTEGAIVVSHTFRDPEAASRARRVAEDLLNLTLERNRKDARKTTT